jgi:3-phosphoglycerate kinase
MINNNPIGLFDSGIGGTSIWKAIHQLMPNENTIYLADSKNAPYGQKSKEEIIALSKKNTELLLENNCKIVILTYVGRPDGKVVESLRTNPHAKKLEQLLNHPVEKIDDCIGPVVDERILKMKQGGILMLENTRFYKEETEDDDELTDH